MNRIKSVLTSQGRTQVWLATQLDVTKGTISSWCNNSIQPSLEKLYKVAELLSVEVSDLLVPIKKLNK